MANYYGFTRTNYFRVKDEEKFREIIENCYSEDDIEIWTRHDEETKETLFAFGAEGSIDYNSEYETLEEKLQEIVASDDTIIITEVGHEKLRYLVGYSIIITENEIKDINLQYLSLELAKEMLNNQNFDTEFNY